MSLLMDALKKAEEEKKKAAKRLEQVDNNAGADESENADSEQQFNISGEYARPERLTDTMKLSLEPIDERSDQKAPPQNETTKVETKEPEASKEEQQLEEEKTSEISMEDISFSEDMTVENPVAEEAFEQTQEAIDLSDTTIIENLSTEDAPASFDDTFHGVLFNKEDEDADVYEETLPGVPADQLVKDMGGGKYQPTPVAAQTVFSAGRAKKKSRSNWGIFFVLAILAFGSFGVFYYFTITPVARKLPSPIVARGIESSPVPSPALSQLKEPDVISGTIISEQADATAVENNEQDVLDEETASTPQDDSVVMAEKEIKLNEEAVEPEKTVVESVPAETIVEAAKSDTKQVTKMVETPEAAVIEDEQVAPQADVVDAEPSRPMVPANSELMEISKNKTPLKQNAMISEAFKAYQAGEFESAEKLYQNALRDDPESRDIHLGLAATAINRGDRESAYRHYLKILDLNPDDALALSSLIALSNNSDPVKDESIIKTLIHKEGNLPYLYFALGNIYAKQLRWSDAQEAFFNAYRLDSTNPDYVLNLAVSLDNIGQYATALDFYNVAVELAQYTVAGFDVSSVNDRIQVLNKVVEKIL